MRAFRSRWQSRGFTLIETMVAITLLTLSIIAPMALTVQSLESAYYARDEITAENLAQEGIETVRAYRDGNILLSAESASANSTDLFAGIPINTPFTIDPHNLGTPFPCQGNSCTSVYLQTNGQLYGYSASGWTTTNFQRYAVATPVMSDTSGVRQEIKLTVTVNYKTGSYAPRSLSISENLYNWVNPGSASPQ